MPTSNPQPTGWRVHRPQRREASAHEDGERVLSRDACLNPLTTPQALAALESETDLPFEVFDEVAVEPTEESWRSAIAWARKHDFSHFLA